jgi:hypothetical protein
VELEKREQTISRILSWATISLRHPSPDVCSDLTRRPGPLRAHGGGPPQASLFDLAPDGVCPASDFTAAAVGSYPTFSPLPPTHLAADRLAVCFLWHFPSPVSRGLGVTQHPVQWSSDFPPPGPCGPKSGRLSAPEGRITQGPTRGTEERMEDKRRV